MTPARSRRARTGLEAKGRDPLIGLLRAALIPAMLLAGDSRLASDLRPGMQLVYASEGRDQVPWVVELTEPGAASCIPEAAAKLACVATAVAPSAGIDPAVSPDPASAAAGAAAVDPADAVASRLHPAATTAAAMTSVIQKQRAMSDLPGLRSLSFAFNVEAAVKKGSIQFITSPGSHLADIPPRIHPGRGS